MNRMRNVSDAIEHLAILASSGGMLMFAASAAEKLKESEVNDGTTVTGFQSARLAERDHRR